MKSVFIPLLLSIQLLGCASYSLVTPGGHNLDGLRVHTSQAWNQAPGMATPNSRAGSAVWTQDGLLLDRLIIIPAVPDGEPVFKSNDKTIALPVFRVGMMPNEIEELTESSITKLFGEAEVAVDTSRLRPHRFGAHHGFIFDLQMEISDGPDYGGVAGAFIAEARLNLIIYLAARPYYYEKHLDEAMAVIRSATL